MREDFVGQLRVDVEEGGCGWAVRDGGYADGREGMGGVFAGQEVGVDLLAEFEGEAEEGWLLPLSSHWVLRRPAKVAK